MHQKKGQVITVEYVIMIILIVAIIVAMTAFIRRALAGRIRDAGVMATKKAALISGKTVLLEYEPYYAQSSATTDREQSKEEKTLTTGGAIVGTSMQTKMSSTSKQFAPQN